MHPAPRFLYDARVVAFNQYSGCLFSSACRLAFIIKRLRSLEPAGLTTQIKFTRAMLGRCQTVWGTLYGRGGITVTSIRSIQERK